MTLLMDAVLLAIVVYRGSVNWLSLWTIVVTGFGALLTLLLPRRLDVIMLGSLLIIVGAFPAFIGGLGLLFVPLAGGLLVAGMRSRWMAN
ncbi:MAG: hypothetical protein M1399_04355 [Actinobacteria bacterium]|nr:hypothetical protein [Actinomycetota bacterium]MCL5447491.1 hypothetical protein [Actinomycetota bacterium]